MSEVAPFQPANRTAGRRTATQLLEPRKWLYRSSPHCVTRPSPSRNSRWGNRVRHSRYLFRKMDRSPSVLFAVGRCLQLSGASYEVLLLMLSGVGFTAPSSQAAQGPQSPLVLPNLQTRTFSRTLFGHEGAPELLGTLRIPSVIVIIRGPGSESVSLCQRRCLDAPLLE